MLQESNQLATRPGSSCQYALVRGRHSGVDGTVQLRNQEPGGALVGTRGVHVSEAAEDEEHGGRSARHPLIPN